MNSRPRVKDAAGVRIDPYAEAIPPSVPPRVLNRFSMTYSDQTAAWYSTKYTARRTDRYVWNRSIQIFFRWLCTVRPSASAWSVPAGPPDRRGRCRVDRINRRSEFAAVKLGGRGDHRPAGV